MTSFDSTGSLGAALVTLLAVQACDISADLRPRPLPPAPPPAYSQVFRYFPSQTLPPVEGQASALYDLIVLDPRWVNVSLSLGWEQEDRVSQDVTALAFISGPTFEISGQGINGAVPQGDIKAAGRLLRSGNRAAANQRAFLGINRQGFMQVGYGAYDPTRHHDLRVFIGGLHILHNGDRRAPAQYKGVYSSISLADIRLLYGVRHDGLLEVVETKDGMTVSRLRDLVRHRDYRAALLPDHASKSRLILPRVRVWSHQHAYWISGGRPAITAMPYLLRVTLDPRITQP
jgi:hypothetical protein